MRLCTASSGAPVTTRQKKSQTRPFFPNAQLDTNYPRWHFFGCCWSIAEPLWRLMVRWSFVYLPTNSMEVFLPVSQEYPKKPQQFHPLPRSGGFNSIKTLPFTAVSLLSPSRGAERKKERCLLPVPVVPKHNVIVLTQFCGTFWQKKRCFLVFQHFFPWSGLDTAVCWAARQLLGDSPPGEQLWSTLWGLNYSFRMATCIQLASHCEEDFTSRGSALLDSLPPHPLHEKHSTKVQAEQDAQITTILDLIEMCEAWNVLWSGACQIWERRRPQKGLDWSPASMEIRQDIHHK